MTEYYSVAELVANTYWKERRFEWSGSNPVYIGINRKIGASESDTEWQVWKLSWSGSNIERMQGPIAGKWENRSSLGW